MENAEMKLSESESIQLIISMISRAKNCVAVAVIVAWIIPGHLLRNKYKVK